MSLLGLERLGSCSWGLEVGVDRKPLGSLSFKAVQAMGDSDCTPDGEVLIWRQGLVLRVGREMSFWVSPRSS